MDLGPHADFIIGAYAFATLIVAGMIGWIVVDHRRQSGGSPTSRRAV